MKGITVVLATAFLLTIHTAEAHPHHKVMVKKANTHLRIHKGVRTGQLTHREARMLRSQQVLVNNYKRIAAADGRITRNEKVIINRAQKNLNRNIYCQKNDGQIRRR